MTEPLFDSAGTFLLRVPVLSKGKALTPLGAVETPAGPDRAEPGSAPGSGALLYEAIAVSSPSLAHRLRQIALGESVAPRIRDKAFASALRYQIRMATRSTPYGLMAGVAVGSFGESPYAAVGHRHRKQVKPDGGWLHDQLKQRLRSVRLDGRDLRVVVNNICSLRAGRLLAPIAVKNGKAVRSSVRCTPVVEALLRLAARPVSTTELHSTLLRKFPEAGSERLWGFLTSLLELGILLSDSFPPPWHDAPLDHVLSRDPDWEQGRRWADLAKAYEGRPVGDGHEALRALQDASGPESTVHIDLAADAEVRLPAAVAREAERAATVLWRLSSTDGPALRAMRAYHAEFLERYSVGERVPVTRLLDPDAGLGAPAGYTLPGSHRVVPPPAEPDAGRQRVLHRLFAEALTADRQHVELSEDDIAALSRQEGDLPSSADVFASVVARSLDSVRQGEFLLVLSPMGGTRQAGAVWGRFAQLLGARATLAELTRAAYSRASHTVPVQLFHTTPAERLSNVTGIPKVADAHLSVGLYEDPAAPGTIRLANVSVSADNDGFHLWDDASQREITPFTAHVLTHSETPDIARFLREAPMLSTRPIAPWDWGSLEASPFLPGVRYGRTVLRPASWRLAAGAFSGAGGAGTDEAQAVARWRRRWHVPDRIRLVDADMFVALDLSRPDHLALLCEEVRKGERVLHEDLTLEGGDSWLRGRDGEHEAEIVVPLLAKQSLVATRPSTLAAPPRRAVDLRRPPGSDWLSVHLYVSEEAQRDVLRTVVGPWVAHLGATIDRWFFIRYADDVTGRPHLRVRLHGDPQTLGASVLPRLGTWMHDLLTEGVIGDAALRTYAPEAERYGGSALITAAEDFFHADSLLTLDRLAEPADPLVVAADLVTLVRRFLRDSTEDAAEWLTRNYPKDHALHRAYAARRHEARTLMAAVPVTDHGDDWGNRLARLGAGLRKAAEDEPWLDASDVLRSLLHMHCNRRLAPSRQKERELYAYARGMADDEMRRRRHQSGNG